MSKKIIVNLKKGWVRDIFAGKKLEIEAKKEVKNCQVIPVWDKGGS